MRTVKLREMTPSKATSSRKLQRRLNVKDLSDLPRGLTYLEARSVRAPTLKDYQARISQFEDWMGMNPVLFSDLQELDNRLLEYLEQLFEVGKGIDQTIRVVAAVQFLTLPRTSRALKGWTHAAPPQQRMPIPLEALGAIIGSSSATYGQASAPC